MSKFIDFFKKVWAWVRIDGLAHFLACAAIVLSLGSFIPIWIAVLVAFGIGLVKELVDLLTKKGTAEWHDVLCDLAGVIYAALVLWVASLVG